MYDHMIPNDSVGLFNRWGRDEIWLPVVDDTCVGVNLNITQLNIWFEIPKYIHRGIWVPYIAAVDLDKWYHM